MVCIQRLLLRTRVNMKITILNFVDAEVDTLELPAELAGAQIEALEGFIIGKGYSLGGIEWMCHE